uniref:Large ribosomal subunit protein uL10 n=1 Tax=Meloidogyne javanica TaxID=6303 RepID=A0A915M1J5_MELJA
MGKGDRTAWKANYFTRIISLFDDYPKCLLVGVDNVGSKQMQEIRQAMRGHGEILMGKNTMIRKAIRGHLQKNPLLEKLLPYIVGNVGFVFTTEDLSEIRKKLLENKRGAPAKAGALAPLDVKLPPQNTGMGPEKTSFFQALQIPTKISRGTIEILNEVHIIKLGEKVGASEAALLNMLNIQPFSYGLAVQQVFDAGAIYSPDVLDITMDDLRARFMNGVRNIAAVSLGISYPTKASIPHIIANAFKRLLSVSAETDVTFKEAEKDELSSDSYPMKLVDDLIFEFKGRQVVRKEGDIALAGANPSAEEMDEGTEEHVERGIDFVLNHRLQEMNCYEDQATFKAYIKDFMKKVIEHMQKQGKSAEQVDAFKKKIQSWVVSLLAKDRFKTLAFFIGENMAEGKGEGQVAIVEYRQEGDEEVPTLMLIKEALEEVKC